MKLIVCEQFGMNTEEMNRIKNFAFGRYVLITSVVAPQYNLISEACLLDE